MDTLQYVYSSSETSDEELEAAVPPKQPLPPPPTGTAKRLSDIAYGGVKRSKSPSPERKSHEKRCSPDGGQRRSPDYRKEKRSSPSYSRSSTSNKEHSRSRDRDYDRDRGRDRHHGDRSKPRRREHRYERRSRSRSPRRSYRESPKRKSKERSRSRSRSPPPPRKHFDPKNKLYILNKMGIDYKGTESVDGPNKAGGTAGVIPPAAGNVTIPNYYNPLAINAGKYAEQIAKRKLLWNNKKTEKAESSTTSSIWQGAKFSQDSDGKMTAKFQRLMGIKEAGSTSGSAPTKGQELIKKQEELFSSMEMQYEVARATTHTQRGVGLGFGPRHIP